MSSEAQSGRHFTVTYYEDWDGNPAVTTEPVTQNISHSVRVDSECVAVFSIKKYPWDKGTYCAIFDSLHDFYETLRKHGDMDETGKIPLGVVAMPVKHGFDVVFKDGACVFHQ